MIPEAAVEAAEEYLSLLMADPNGDYTMEARDLLEAAAPFMFAHIIADATRYIQAQTLRDAAHAFPLETIHAPDNAVVWMMRRADEIRSRI